MDTDNKKAKKRAYDKARRKANYEKKRADAKAYYEANKEKVKVYQKAYHEANKEKKNAYSNTYNKANKDKNKAYKLKKTYNLTIDQHNQLFESQSGCCFICNTHQSEFKNALNVDHDHDTGKVRGLLCHHCNTGIGLLNDNVSAIEDARRYLTRHNRSQKYREVFPEEFDGSVLLRAEESPLSKSSMPTI